MIKEKASQESLILYELLRHPVLGPEFIYNVDVDTKYDKPFEFTWYQQEILCDFNDHTALCTSRAVGKTLSLTSIIFWILVFNIFPADYILYVVPSKVHLEPVFTNLIKLFRNNSFLKNFIERKAGINSSDHKITLLNGASLLCRIAGQSGTGENLIGLHTPFIMADEAGYFPKPAFQEMQPSLNTWTPGFREMVSGVPTGLRENNVLYTADVENDEFTKHRVSAFDNPRITAEDIEGFKEQYGGEDSDDYVHYVLGQHGKPIFSLFDRGAFAMESYPVYKLDIDGIRMEGIGEYIQKISAIPPVPNKTAEVLVGIDLGYTEPTAIIIAYLDAYARIKFHARIKLSKVSYPIQEKIIDFIDSRFNPVLIGMDEGNIGKSTRQHFVEDREYIHKDYKNRLISIDFSAWLSLGVSADGEEIKSKTKPFTVSILQDYSNSHRIIYSTTDLEMISELERMTYTKNPVSGDISYKTLTNKGGKRGEDHFTSALLCCVGAYYLARELITYKEKRKLLRARWI